MTRTDETVELYVQVPKVVMDILEQRQRNQHQYRMPFKPIAEYAVDAMIDGLTREIHQQEKRLRRG